MSARTTPVAALDAFVDASLPQGLVFHVSRCGSTLLARLLAAAPGCRVISEPAIVETLLRATDGDPAERRLRALLAAFAAAPPAPRATVVKFAARAVVDHARIRAACPGVASAVVYRDPAEVLVALVGRSTVLPPGLHASGLLDAADAALSLTPVEFWARVLARQFAAACALAQTPGTLLVGYDELPHAAWRRVAPHFGVALDAADRAAMQARAQQNAKTGAPFADDRAAKRAAVSADIAAAVARLVAPWHAQLEAQRRAQGATMPA